MCVHVHAYLLGVASTYDRGVNVKVEGLKASGLLPKAPTPGRGAVNARDLWECQGSTWSIKSGKVEKRREITFKERKESPP